MINWFLRSSTKTKIFIGLLFSAALILFLTMVLAVMLLTGVFFGGFLSG
jgi:hypothetical protein